MQTQLPRRFAALFALAASAATFAQSTSAVATEATRSPTSVNGECASPAPTAPAAGRESPSRPLATSWDPATGQGTGKRQHGPGVILK